MRERSKGDLCDAGRSWMWRRRRRLGSRQACTQQPAAAPGSSHAISDTRHVDPHAGHCGLDRRCRRMGASSAGHVSVAVITERNPSIRRRAVLQQRCQPTAGSHRRSRPGRAPAQRRRRCCPGAAWVCFASAQQVQWWSGPVSQLQLSQVVGGLAGPTAALACILACGLRAPWRSFRRLHCLGLRLPE